MQDKKNFVVSEDFPIMAFYGKYRQGKTVSAIKYLADYMYRGVPVFSNIPIEGDYDPFLRRKKHIKSTYIPKIQDFMNAMTHEKNCIFFIDEAGSYFSNYSHNVFSQYPGLISRLAQVAHFHTRLVYTVQRFKQTVARLRENSEPIIQCKKIQLGLFDIFINDYYEAEYFGQDGIPRISKQKEYFMFRKVVYPSEFRRAIKLYDSWNELEEEL
jgi:hypothetical protein